MTPLAERIAREGPIGLEALMAAVALDPEHGRYATAATIGRDFATAPEISARFGEMIAVAMSEYWRRGGAPSKLALFEIGGGRGTAMADLWRAAPRDFRRAARLTMIEPSPLLRAAQGRALAAAEPRLESDVDALEAPSPGPVFALANEVLDALPVEQIVKREAGWKAREIVFEAGGLRWRDGPPAAAPPAFDAPLGAIHERSPARARMVARIAGAVRRRGGLALIFDYGAWAPGRATGDTLQAIARGRPVDPLEAPGSADLSCHVEFSEVVRAAKRAGAETFGPIGQGVFLRRLGIEARAASLIARAEPERSRRIRSGVRRLIDPAAMGEMFRALAIVAPGAPPPAGFVDFDREEDA